MEDLIEILQADGDVVVQVGEEIRYDKIEPPLELVHKVGRKILSQMNQNWQGYMWLLAPPDTITEKLKLEDCPIHFQLSALEKFQPIASDILPGNIWNSAGTTFITAMGWLEEQKLIRVFEVRESANGRRGMVILSADLQKDFPSVVKGM
jgi:hypothetical protein